MIWSCWIVMIFFFAFSYGLVLSPELRFITQKPEAIDYIFLRYEKLCKSVSRFFMIFLLIYFLIPIRQLNLLPVWIFNVYFQFYVDKNYHTIFFPSWRIPSWRGIIYFYKFILVWPARRVYRPQKVQSNKASLLRRRRWQKINIRTTFISFMLYMYKSCLQVRLIITKKLACT